MKEFDLIAAIRQMTTTLPANGFEGIGDDCAVLPLGEEALVFTTDALMEGVHFLRHTTSAYDLGHKALAVNLSDVAAMGVTPVAVLLSLSLTAKATERWAHDFMEGFTDLARQHGVALIGGDTTRSEGGISIAVTAIGRGALRDLKRRKDAREGDLILVSAPLGGSAHGLQQLMEGIEEGHCVEAHRRPQPEIEAGCWLGKREEVHAMMDLSDGIHSDLRHIVEASGMDAEVDVARIPVAEGATRDEAIVGGEEYKLLLTADGASAEALCRAFTEQFGRPLYPIGRITNASESPSIAWFDGGEPFNCTKKGFEHFSE
ncbi:MAG: thiamine-phosphate kinase [Alistipes sp.]|nr:thiamine-phosphate kinase [Alistipes sp.]